MEKRGGALILINGKPTRGFLRNEFLLEKKIENTEKPLHLIIDIIFDGDLVFET